MEDSENLILVILFLLDISLISLQIELESYISGYVHGLITSDLSGLTITNYRV